MRFVSDFSPSSMLYQTNGAESALAQVVQNLDFVVLRVVRSSYFRFRPIDIYFHIGVNIPLEIECFKCFVNQMFM